MWVRVGRWFHGGPCSLAGGVQVFDYGLPVQVRGPVDQVEAPEQNREHDAGDAVDLADAVEGLLVLLGLGLGLVGRLGDGGQRGVFGDVGRVVGHGHGVGVVLLHDGSFLFLQQRHNRLFESAEMVTTST